MKKLRAVCIGAGYFSHFQYEAWTRIPEVEVTAMCNSNMERANPIMERYDIKNHYTDYKDMIDKEKPDFVDIITPPETHLEMTEYAAGKGIHVICQKPLTPTMDQAKALMEIVKKSGIQFMVHENWRFQPWYREIKQLLKQRVIGEVHSVNFRKRMGDGWGENAYIPRQPYFRDYPRLIVYENGIHFIDTFRYLFGEVKEVYAKMRKLNPVIAGEDWAVILFEFENGVNAIWDANRYNEPNYENPRYTFGEMLIDGFGGSIRLYADGKITIQTLGEPEIDHDYSPSKVGFSGDCVYITQRHFIDGLMNKIDSFETSGDEYLRSLSVQEAVYESALQNKPLHVNYNKCIE